MATQSRYDLQRQHYGRRSQNYFQNGTGERIANGLGWFSIGLGLAEIVAPRSLARLIGLSDEGRTRNLLRFYGVREVAAGVGILSQSNPSRWLWARVAGDLLDLSSLSKAMTSSDNERGKTGLATAAVLGVTALDLICAQQLSRKSDQDGAEQTAPPQIRRSVIIDRSQEEIYSFWRDFSRLPQIFRQLESVEVTEANRSHWRLQTPIGRTLEWDAEITEDEPNSRIAWRSDSPAAKHSGTVRFTRAPGGRGTKVSVEMQLGAFGAQLGKLFRMLPEQAVGVALHNLKQILETGEIVQSDASIHTGMHPGRPSRNQPPAQSMHATA